MIDLFLMLWTLSPLLMLVCYFKQELAPLFYLFAYLSLCLIFALLIGQYFIYAILAIIYLHLDYKDD